MRLKGLFFVAVLLVFTGVCHAQNAVKKPMRGIDQTFESLAGRCDVDFRQSIGMYASQRLSLKDCVLSVDRKWSKTSGGNPSRIERITIPLAKTASGNLKMNYPDMDAWELVVEAMGQADAFTVQVKDVDKGREKTVKMNTALIYAKAGKNTAKAGKDLLHLVRICGGGVQNELLKKIRDKE